jgi:hypothetical protein
LKTSVKGTGSLQIHSRLNAELDGSMWQPRTLLMQQADKLVATLRLNEDLPARFALLEAENRGLRGSLATVPEQSSASAAPPLHRHFLPLVKKVGSWRSPTGSLST